MNEEKGENVKQEACIIIVKVGEGRFCRECVEKIYGKGGWRNGRRGGGRISNIFRIKEVFGKGGDNGRRQMYMMERIQKGRGNTMEVQQ